MEDFITITGLKIFAHHGVLPEETLKGQDFFVNAKLYTDMTRAAESDEIEDAVHYGFVCEKITNFLQENTYKLLEMAVTQTCKAVLLEFEEINAIEMELCKPNAPIPLPFENVSVTRKLGWHKVYIAVGSNMGDKQRYIEDAIEELKQDKDFRFLKCSSLIVTKPYGGVEQDDFVNGALEVETLLSPSQLLDRLHVLEQKAQRKREIHWGPRTLDLDILFYDDLICDLQRLTIPHADMKNRMFVLGPMCELNPYLRHPVYNKTVQELFDDLKSQGKE